ncbi:ComF family protein [Sphingomonas sp. 1P06PA]|uniref:ComF family protein n=1 Tax=Sphingomonas sp. 1P06PA TaxID=554121 RepID=UPI0039A436BC
MIALSRLAGAVIDFALPPRCPGCGAVTAGDHQFCIECWSRLDFLAAPACRTCGEPIGLIEEPGAQCADCLGRPPAIDAMRAAVAYGAIARALALRLKHARRPGIAITMARLMRRHLDPADAPLLVPVPLHRWRIWRRGFNQSALIARALARDSGCPLALDALVRSKQTPILRGLGAGARARAVRGAFAVTADGRQLVKGRRIVLIDDVHTSGATADACARALKKAGAARVELLCWARVGRAGELER